MKTRFVSGVLFTFAIAVYVGAMGAQQKPASGRPQGPCDIYGAAGDPCVAAHSTTRALYAGYSGPLYQVIRQSDNKTLDIGVISPSAGDPGGYADAGAQDKFCANTVCWISRIYDQSPKKNDLFQAPRGFFSGPAMGGANNLPVADMAPISVMGHKVYGVFIAPGMGLRQNDAKGTAVDDQAEGQYWVINGHHFNSGCCFDYGNAEIDSRDDLNGTMETTYFGDTLPWYHGNPPGPWVMTDQENNLVGCVNPDGSKLCKDLPNITWRFVTAMAKGEPHHWASMGGDAQKGNLQVMFDGPRVNLSYDPMRKQGAILLGNGGDNSVGSQGTFYEGAMTAAGTYPTNATDQLVQANVVAAKYALPPVVLGPASAGEMLPGLQTFTPGSSQETKVTFTNTTDAPVSGVKLGLTLPAKWTAEGSPKTFTEAIAPGASVTATFKVTSGPAPYNGDMVATATWDKRSESIAEKVRNGSAVKINEFRVGSTANPTDGFIELYNAGATPVDVSNWTLTQHQTTQPIFSAVKIPAGTKLAPKAFYVLGLSTSGLVTSAKAGDKTLFVRNVAGISAGDSITVGTGAEAETRKVASVGTAATPFTTVWQPLPDGPIMQFPVGTTNLPVASVDGFTVGQKIAIGYGSTQPAVARSMEKYEIATVTSVGKPGTQIYIAVEAPAGATNVQVTNIGNGSPTGDMAYISAGDKIRFDIDSMGHGIETVTVKKVGTPALRSTLGTPVQPGETTIRVRNMNGFSKGDKILVGTPANVKSYTITAVGTPGQTGTGLTLTPAFAEAHSPGEDVVLPGTGLELEAPLKFTHAANLPFSARGTGITFEPATKMAHESNEPVQALGTGITLDSAVAKAHDIDAAVIDEKVTTAGYQGSKPHQWMGGPVLSTLAGNMVLRDSGGLVMDSLNYGLLVDPWASEGYHAVSGAGHGGCRVAVPGVGMSAGRFPDGTDTDSNCTDFQAEPAAMLAAASTAGAQNLKVTSVVGFTPGQPVMVGVGSDAEKTTVATVGTAGATTVVNATEAGATGVPVASLVGFVNGQKIIVGGEEATVNQLNRVTNTVNLTAPLKQAHAVGAEVTGTGLTLSSALSKPHAAMTQLGGNASTPGAPNQYFRRAQ